MSSRCPGAGGFVRALVPSLVGVVRSGWENRRVWPWAHPMEDIRAMGQSHEPRTPSALLCAFLVLFARWYMAMLGKALRLMPSVALAVLQGVVQRLVLPLVALDMEYVQLHAPAPVHECDDAQCFFGNGSAAATTTSSEEKRMLRHMLAFFKKVQRVIRADGPIGTAEKARAVGALVAGTTATFRTCGVPFGKINALLIPVLEVTVMFRPRARAVCALVAGNTATLRACGVPFENTNALLVRVLEITVLLRPRTGVPPITDARRAYLLSQVFQRADALENITAQALWVEAWPTVPAELGTAIKPDLAKETETRADKALRSSAIHCGPRRRASAKTNPRSSHLRGSGAVVVA